MQMSLIRRALCASTAIVCAAAMPVGAHAAQEVRQFAIDAQPAETAVSLIGYQGGVQIIAQRKLLRDVRTNAVRGAFTVSEAMSRLFVDTSLEARQTGPNTYVVVAKPDALRPARHVAALTADPAPQPAAAPSAPAAAPETGTIIVTGLRASLDSARGIKRNSLGIVDAIATKDIGKLPDANLAESLQRVSGVSIVRAAKARSSPSAVLAPNSTPC